MGSCAEHFISVGWDGKLFDCDFNQMLDMPVVPHNPQTIYEFDYHTLAHRRIGTGPTLLWVYGRLRLILWWNPNVTRSFTFQVSGFRVAKLRGAQDRKTRERSGAPKNNETPFSGGLFDFALLLTSYHQTKNF